MLFQSELSPIFISFFTPFSIIGRWRKPQAQVIKWQREIQS